MSIIVKYTCTNQKNMVSAIDENGNTLRVTKEEFDKNDKLFGVTKNQNNNTSEYLIFDSDGKIQYKVVNKSFIKFCRENGLPPALVKSYQNNGEPIYKNIGSNLNRLEKMA